MGYGHHVSQAVRCAALLAASPGWVAADVIRDGTVGPSDSFQPVGPHFEITETLGEVHGSNLFHSFEEFSLSPSESATFSSTSPVSNIISRITGGAPSQIDGVLRSVIPGADFYLINPNGVMFGPEAEVDLAGAFHASTAPTLKFDNGDELSADTDVPPMLSVAAPVEFGLLHASAGIELQGTQLINPPGVELSATSIALNEGGSVITSAEGDTFVGNISLNASERIVLQGMDSEQKDARVEAVAFGDRDAGIIRLAAPVIDLRDGAAVTVATVGSAAGGTLYVNADRQVVLSGTNARGLGTTLQAVAFGSGNAGSIHVEAPVIELKDGAFISTVGSGAGRGGDLVIESTGRLSLSGADGRGRGSNLQGGTSGDGVGGSVRVRGRTIELRDGAFFITGALGGSGAAGDLIVYADQRIALHGTDQRGFGATLMATTYSAGDGGSIYLRSPVIELTDHASIRATSLGSGTAGNISVEATSAMTVAENSSITTQSATTAGGDIAINVDGLFYLNGGKITTDVARGEGSGGNINIRPKIAVFNHGEVTAKADAGHGGEIRIGARYFFSSPDSVFDASAGATGISGRVETTIPDTNVAEVLSRPPAAFVDTAALLRPTCGTKYSRGEGGQFVIAQQSGLPLSPEELLLAFDPTFMAPQIHTSQNQPLSIQEWLQVANSETIRGHGETADRAWRAAAALQQLEGRYADSVVPLLENLAQAQRDDDPRRIAASLGGLGNAYLALGQYAAAESLLNEALAVTRGPGASDLAPVLLNNRGNLHMVSQEYAAALDAYRESARLAAETGQVALRVKALANAVRSALAGNQLEVAEALLNEARAEIARTQNDSDKARVYIHLATSEQRLAMRLAPDARHSRMGQAYRELRESAMLSDALGEMRLLSYALGHLGVLYQQERRWTEALYLIRSAQRVAEESGSPESLYRWYWQEGQVLWVQEEWEQALAAFRRAVNILESTRQETMVQYGDANSYFRSWVAPVYLELAAALLQSSERAENPLPLLLEARATAEQLKAAELRNYFNDDCLAAAQARITGLDNVSDDAAVVYPIVLKDRLELLVSLAGTLTRHVVHVDSDTLGHTVRQFREWLEARDPWRYLGPAEQLYDWLVLPYEHLLAAAGVNTLVFVPDGPLRTVPMSALHDGEQFLVGSYSVAIAPGLALTDPRPLERSGGQVLLAGLSAAAHGFPALPSVARELRAVHRAYGGRLLLNHEFTESRLQNALAEPIAILHVASHARFTGSSEGNYLLTYDGRMGFDQFARLVETTRFRDQPIELLVLSACQTAAGDERAALGLAGIGIKAGARSALGSLWAISDEAAAQFMKVFYERLKISHVTKARALRDAQNQLRGMSRFSHPYYWSAFVLVNNWL